MDSSLFFSLFIVFALVALNGFFVAAEFSLVTVRKTRIDELVKQKNSNASFVQKALCDLDRYIAGTQVGITIASLALGWVGDAIAEKIIKFILTFIPITLSTHIMHVISISCSFIFITFLHVILGELIPKSIALQFSEKTALWVGRPMSIIIILFRPLIWSLNGCGQFILRLMGFKAAAEHASSHSSAELISLIQESHRAERLDEFEVSMLQKTFRFSETGVSSVMTSRSDMVAFDCSETLEEIVAKVKKNQHTRFPVYRDDIDNIIGVVYIHDLFLAIGQNSYVSVEALVRPATFIPEYFQLDAMVEKFQEERTHMAVIVDEHGGVAGIITLDDVIESVFGEIRDRNDDEKEEIKEEDNGIITLRGDARIEGVNDQLGWEIDGTDFDTISGFVMQEMGRIPKSGDEFSCSYGHFKIMEMQRFKIIEIKVKKLK